MGVVVDQNVALDGAAEVLATDCVTHIEGFEHREPVDEFQGRVAVGEHLGTLHPAGMGIPAVGEAVRWNERLSVAGQPGCVQAVVQAAASIFSCAALLVSSQPKPSFSRPKWP